MIESRECAARDRSAVATLTIEAHHGTHLPYRRSRLAPASRTARPRCCRAKQRLYNPRAPAHRGGRAPSVPHQEQGREFRAGCGRGLAEPLQLGRPPSGAVVSGPHAIHESKEGRAHGPLCFRVWRGATTQPLPKAGGLVEAAQQVLGHNPLEILFLALDAVPRAPVRLYGQAREDCIDAVSYTHLRAHETRHDLVCRLLLEKKKNI